MFKNVITSIFSALALTAMLSSPALANTEGAKQKVVYHVNYYGAKQQQAALRNVQNHINAVGAENLDLKIVLHGNGISMLMEPDALGTNKMKEGNADQAMQVRISTLKDQGVQFKVCNNTLQGRKVSTDTLYDFDKADIVASGVAQLAILQADGYAYIKP